MQISTMKEYDQETLFVDFSHLQTYEHMLAAAVAEEYYRFEPFLRKAVQSVVHEYHPDFANQEGEPKEFFVAFYNMGAQLK